MEEAVNGDAIEVDRLFRENTDGMTIDAFKDMLKKDNLDNGRFYDVLKNFLYLDETVNRIRHLMYSGRACTTEDMREKFLENVTTSLGSFAFR